MKKIITMAYLSVAVLGATMTFTSCGSNNDEPKGEVVETGTEVNPLRVFTGGMPVSFAGATILKNIKGQVSTIQSKDEMVTFEYKDMSTHASEAQPQVVMTIKHKKSMLTYVCNLYLGKDGFVKHCDETKISQSHLNKGSGTGKETWDFTYNNDGQLLTMLRSDGGYKKTTIKYQDGNIVETTTTSAVYSDHKHSYKIFYTSESALSPIVNKGCLMLFDYTLGIDMDEMQYAYYAGLLGKATKNLPVKQVDNENDTDHFTWTLNSNGYPIFFKSDYYNSYSYPYSFSW